MYGAKGLRERDAESMPGLVVIDKAGVARSVTRQNVTTVRKANTDNQNRQVFTSAPAHTSGSQPVQATKMPSEPKRKLTAEELERIAIGHVVQHRTFGKGRIISLDGSYVEVAFDTDDKRKKPSRKFMFPGAFEQDLLRIIG